MSSTPTLAGTLVSAAVTMAGVALPLVATHVRKKSSRAALARDIELIKKVELPEARKTLEASITRRIEDLAAREDYALGRRDELAAIYFFLGILLVGFAFWTAAATTHGWFSHPLALIGTILLGVPLGVFVITGVVVVCRTDPAQEFFRWASPRLPAEWVANAWRTVKRTVSGWFGSARAFVRRKTHKRGTGPSTQQ